MHSAWYINWQRSRSWQQTTRLSATMRASILITITAYVNLLVVQGLNVNSSSRRVLYGQSANVADFPFLVKLGLGPNIGGGAIISNQWILTAGHCVFGLECATIKIFPAIWESQDAIQPVECHPHPQYIGPQNLHRYDIGLMKVQEDILKDGRAKAIPLPAPGTSYPVGTPAVVVGWGLAENGIYLDRLSWGEVRVEDRVVCNKKYHDHDVACRDNPYCIPIEIPRRLVCTQGDGDSPSGTCFGDSGGPVIINGAIAGVVSFGLYVDDVCTTGAPSMHVNVVDYLPWIYSLVDPTVDTSQMTVQPEF